MKTIVEFGIPGSALPNRPTGVSGQIVFPSAKQAERAVKHIAWVLSKGKATTPMLLATKSVPRKTFWPGDHSYWIAVSLLDGVMRGAYAAVADKEN